MKSKIIMVAAMLGLLATACNKENEIQQQDLTQTPITIKATYGSSSKVSYTETGNAINAKWQSGDKLLVVYNNHVNELSLSSYSVDTTVAWFSGSITGTPTDGASLVCYVKDQNTPSGTITVNGDGSYIYTSDAFLGQDGTLAGAARLNLYCGWTRYSSTSDINCYFNVNTAMMKFTVNGIDDDAGETGSITYKSNGTEIARATFTVAIGTNIVYLTIPAGYYYGPQFLVYTCGETEMTYRLAASQATFTAGQTYSKDIDFNDSYNTPLTFEAKTANAIVMFVNNNMSVNLEYSKNGGPWTNYTEYITLENIGDKVSFRGDNEYFSRSYSSHGRFLCTGQCYIYGNIMSLLYSNGFATATKLAGEFTFYHLFYNNNTIYNHPSKHLVLPAVTLTPYCYFYMFQGCTNLTTAPELPALYLSSNCYEHMFDGCIGLTSAPNLPSKNLAYDCYCCMFLGCTSLTSAPNLPATTLAEGCYARMFESTGLTSSPALPATMLTSDCYAGMFKNCTSLISAPDLPSTAMTERCYTYMFEGCSNLTSAPNLPATTLAANCYDRMFAGCTNLTSAPDLPATTLAIECYNKMFVNCSSLTSAPALPAMTLTNACYRGMFSGCTSLTMAPDLPALILTQNCYYEMFMNCTNLNSVKCLAADISASGCTTNWLAYVAEAGTFSKAAYMTNWTNNSYSSIPTGWTVVDAQ